MKGQRIVTSFVDVMKLLRTEAMTRAEIADAAEVRLDTASRWVRDLQQHGFIAECGKAPRSDGIGKPSQLYSVTKTWGGNA